MESANLKGKIAEDKKQAMRDKNAMLLSTLRMLSASIANKEIELRKKDIGLSDSEVLDVIASEVKRRKDAMLEYQKAGREELQKKEAEEMAMLTRYLPPEISDEDLFRIVEDGIHEVGGKGETDFGKVMRAIMPTLKGKASGDRISEMVRRELGKV